MPQLQEELRSRRSAELPVGFTVRDPYEICAAYLLLEKENDVLTALNMLTGAVIACVDRHLPWAMGPRLSCIQADEDGALNYGLRIRSVNRRMRKTIRPVFMRRTEITPPSHSCFIWLLVISCPEGGYRPNT